MKPLRAFAALACLICILNAARADSLRLVKDIRTDISNEISSNPPARMMIGQRLFYASADGAHGLELWLSTGASAGTYLLKDIFPGAASSEPDQFVVANGILYFTALHPDYGRELWCSDGTAAGTRLVCDIRPGFEPSGVQNAVAIGGALYFSASDGQSGAELWKTDGTSAGTVRVRDINPGTASSSPHDFAVLNNVLYFGASDGVHGDELWRSDGTGAGTSMVKDLRPGDSSAPTLLTPGNGLIYFSAKGSDGKDAIWKTDGTAAGTSVFLAVSCKTILFANNKLFFTKTDSGSSIQPALVPPAPPKYELWTSDGTTAGTIRIYAGHGGAPFTEFLVIGGKLYFSNATAPVVWPYLGHPPELHRVDTETYQLEEIPNIKTDIRDLVAFAGKPYFLNNAGLQVVDSTTTPTLISPPGDAVPGFLDAGSQYMLFGRFPGSIGTGQLWRSDGTSPGTVKIAAIGYRTSSSVKAPFAETNGTVKFLGMDAEHGQEVWRSDLTDAGTKLLVDLMPGIESCYLSRMVSWRAVLYFGATDKSYKQKLWRSDGSAAGTQPIFTVPDNWYLDSLYGGSKSFLCFVIGTRTSSGTGYSMWKSDGTSNGTTLIKTFNESVEIVTELNGLVYFNVLDNGYYRLWRTDGTPAGTIKLLDSGMEQSVVQNEVLYFITMNQSQQYRNQLWRTTGSAGGTWMISNDSPMETTSMGGDVYFAGYGDGKPPRLSKLDVIKMQISLVDEGTTTSEVFSGLMSSGNRLYYTYEKFFYTGGHITKILASDGSPWADVTLATFTGAGARKQITTDGKLFIAGLGDAAVYGDDQLWLSDGTQAGTALLKSGLNIMQDDHVFGLAVGTRYFFINRAPAGNQLWVSDGTAAGTKMLMLLEPDETVLTDLGPDFFLKGDGRIVIAANDGVWGKELWAFIPNEVEVLSPKAGNTFANGGWLTIHWRMDMPTAGPVVHLELWKGNLFVANLLDSWRANGDGTDQIALPPVPAGSDYRIRAVSNSNPSLQAWSAYFTITSQPRNAAGSWMLYQ